MVTFENDYSAGAHPRVIQRLLETNLEPLTGYGNDGYCQSAKEKIRAACGCPEADVFFLTGGTQANAVVTGTLLKPYQGVVSASTGHVAVHEAGAVEYAGHKVLTLPHHGGKLSPAEVEDYLRRFYQDETHTSMVFPGMVYISHPTEFGTLYTKQELEQLAALCRAYSIPLFLDGARLGYGLASRETDVTLETIAACCDVFYIGGTKVGALCGEAIVFPKGSAPEYFMTMAKQRGALLAKGRLLGVQFDALFTDGLYWEIGRHAIEMAERLKALLKEKNCRFYLESPTNQQFLIFEDGELKRLRENIVVSFWEKVDANHTAVRLATSWATTEEDLEQLRRSL